MLNKYTRKAILLIPSRSAFAKKRGISRQAITNWLTHGIAAQHVIALEKEIDGKVTRYQMRPDLFE